MNLALSLVFPVKSIWLKSRSACCVYWSSPRQPFQMCFCSLFFTNRALTNWVSPNCFSSALQHENIFKHTRQYVIVIKTDFSVTLYGFTNMEFFNQQRHNMPKSGVSLGAVIILHAQKTTLRYPSLSTGQSHIHRYEFPKDITTDKSPHVRENSSLSWICSLIVEEFKCISAMPLTQIKLSHIR